MSWVRIFFGAGYHDTIPPLNDECYESSLIEDLVCLDIDDGSRQEELEHSSLVPKYV